VARFDQHPDGAGEYLIAVESKDMGSLVQPEYQQNSSTHTNGTEERREDSQVQGRSHRRSEY